MNKMENIQVVIEKMIGFSQTLERLKLKFQDTDKTIEEFSTAYIIFCHDSPQLVVIGSKAEAGNKMGMLEKEAKEDEDRQLSNLAEDYFYIKEIKWE